MKTEIEIRRARNAYRKRYEDATENGDLHRQGLCLHALGILDWVLDTGRDINKIDKIIEDYIRSSKSE